MSSFDELLEQELDKKKKKNKVYQATSLLPDVPASGKVPLTTGSLSYLPTFTAPLSTNVQTAVKFSAPSVTETEDIAPLMTVGSLWKKDEEEDKLDFFQKSKVFSDGYDVGDITKTILGTVGDAGVNAVHGLLNISEGIADAATYGAAGIADRLGKDDTAKRWRKEAAKDEVGSWLKGADDYLDQYSVLGRTSDSILQGVGQVGGMIALGAVGGAVGLGAAGTTALTTGVMGLSGIGSGTSEAYRAGATDEEARTYGIISGAADALSELLFGGLGKAVNAVGFSKGLSSVDDMLAKKVSVLFQSQLAKNIAEYGIKAGAEGFEEVVAGTAQAIGKKLTYMSEKDLGEILEDENLLEQFVVGAVASSIAQAPGVHSANKAGTDFITGQTQNEQAVVKKEVENRIAEQEKDGKKLSAKEKSAIEAQVEKDLERGYISTDTIEEVLGGDSYKAYKDTVDSEDAILKEFDSLYKMKTGDMTGEQIDRLAELKQKAQDIKSNSQRNQLKQQLGDTVKEMAKSDRLIESYNEKARAFEVFRADFDKFKGAKHEDAAKKTLESAVKAEANNTNRIRDLVEMAAKISGDTGLVFEFSGSKQIKANFIERQNKEIAKIESIPEAERTAEQNAMLTEMKNLVAKVESGKTKIHGEISDSGIVLNLDSPKPLNRTVGHEVTHSLETAKSYEGLRDTLFAYAKEKGVDVDGELATLKAQYAGVTNANPEAELVADLVGDFLFTDPDFASNLATRDRNIFQKIYDEIKYLVKIATAGSKEARELERVKRSFEKAYRESVDAQQSEEISDTKTKYSIREEAPPKNTGVAYKVFFVKDGKLYPPMVANPGGADTPMGVWLNADMGTAAPPSKTGRAQVKAGGKGTQGGGGSLAFRPGWHLGDLPRASQFDRVNPETGKKELFPENFVWAEVEYAKDVDYQEEAMSYGYTENGKFRHAYAGLPRLPENGYYRYRTNPKPDTVPWVITGAMKVNRLLSDAEVNAILEKNGVAPVHRQGGDVGLEKFGFKEDGTVKYSLSEEQQKFFKDSVVRDESGNLKVMYNGTSAGGHTVFDPYGKARYGLFGAGSYFTDSKTIAESYTKKGKGKSPQVYETYLNIKNPMDMDAAADPSAWAEAFPDASFPESGTNEDFYRAMEEYFEDNEYPRWEAAESAMEAIEVMGYDGITHIGGGRVRADSERHRVYIAFQPEQIKSVDNKTPSADPDIRYSLSEDSDGKRLTEAQADYFKKSKMRDDNGNLKPMYHGSKDGGFHTFDPSYSDDSISLFFVDSNDVASSYSGTSETYAARSFKTAEDFNKFFAEIGTTEYEVREKDGKFQFYENGDLEAESDTAEGIYEEFRDWSGLGYGDVNYKVYLNLENPLEVDAGGEEWSEVKIPNQHIAKFNETVFQNPDPYGFLDTATTRSFAEYAKAEGYDGVIFKNILDVGGYGGKYNPHTVAIAFYSNQVKSVANGQPTPAADIRYSLSDLDSSYQEDIKNGDMLSAERAVEKAANLAMPDSKIRDKAGNLIPVYHGTKDMFYVFDTSVKGGVNGTAEGFGIYTSDDPEVTGVYGNRQIKMYANITKPATSTKKTITASKLAALIKDTCKREAQRLVDDGEYDSVKEALMDTWVSNYVYTYDIGMAQAYKDTASTILRQNDNDMAIIQEVMSGMAIRDYAAATAFYRDSLIPITGFDGIVTHWENAETGKKSNIILAFDSSQLKSADPVTYDDAGNVIPLAERFDPTNADIRYSLPDGGEQVKNPSRYDVYGKDFRVQEEIAPVAETATVAENATVGDVAEIATTDVEPTAVPATVSKEEMVEMFPDDPDTAWAELDRLNQERDALEARMLSMADSGDFTDLEAVGAQHSQVMERIAELEGEISESDDGRMDSITDEDAPPEMDAPYYGEPSEPAAPADPFEDRDISDVGDRKVKAYQYENPEVKPFFMEAALGMLDDLSRTTKGEKIFNGDLYYESGGEYGWMGTKRSTTDDIAELLDVWNYSYAQIEKGLNAIIEDDGKENNAVSKRIEFMLNDRLMNGYTAAWGEYIPPNQGYIDLLNEKQITEYSKEAFDSFMATADQYAPAEDDIAPAPAPAQTVPMETALGSKEVSGQQTYIPHDATYDAVPDDADIGPTAELASGQKVLYELINPRKQPKMVRVDKAGNEQVAQVLVEEPAPEKKRNKLWSMVKENVLDNGMVFEDLALKTKNRDLQAKWNFRRYAQSMSQRMVGNGANGVKSLNAIREEVEQTGKVQQFYEYLYHRHNADRMRLEERYEDVPNKPVFGYNVTADHSDMVAREIEQANPNFRRYARDVYNYMNHLRTMMVNNGIISQDTANLWAEMYPHYVPIRRAGDNGLNINVPLDTGRTGVNAPVKRATGGNRDILPLFDTMGQRTMQTFRAIANNSFGVELKKTLGTTIDRAQTDLDGMIDTMDNQDGLLQEGKNGRKPTFTVFENGEKVTFEITEEMYDAMKPNGDGWSATVPVLSTASKIHRGLLTEYNPVFMATNAIKDTQDILINSQHPAKTYANLPRATLELARKGKWYQEYMENGGEDNSYFDGETNTFDTKEKGARKLLGLPPLSWISKANNFIERTPRLAEYIASRESGRSIEVSMLDAARVTTNFAAGGKLTKFANRNGATFLNASVQGVVQQARNIREAKANGLKGWAQLAGKVIVAGLPAILLNNSMWDDDEEYEELSDYVKQNYYIVGKFGDGKFVRIPKGRTVAVIQNAIEQITNAATGNDEADLKSFLELVVSNLAPNNPIEDNILAPIIQVAKNETWYGEDLVPTRLQDVPIKEQFDESTDELSKWLGDTWLAEKLNLSPYKINYLLDQYSGGIGDTILPMLTPEAESGNDTTLGNLFAPMKSKFTTDSVMNNQNVADFYDVKDELATNAKASTATDEDKLMSKYMNSVNSELAELYAKKRDIQNSGFSAAYKYEKVRDIQSQIVALTKEGLATYEDIVYEGDIARIGDRMYQKNADGEWQKFSAEQATKYEVTKAAGDALYATDGTNHYRWYEPGEDAGEGAEPGWRKVTGKELERQKEVTSGLGITAEEYWSNREEYTYAYDNPESYAMAKSVGGYTAYKQYSSDLYDIKADKDKYGKSISGSRKAKVLDYINGLDADYYTKLILYKSEYPSYDDANYEIIDYLNGRDDISFDEMRAILIKLDFKVDAEGNIFW